MQTILTSPALLLEWMLQRDELPEERRAAASAALRATRRPTVTWAHPAPGVHVIDGQWVDSDLIGLALAYHAIGASWRRQVLVADFVAPGSRHPDVAARAALKRAAAFIEPLRPGLADAVRSICVTGGYAIFRPSGRLDVVAGNPALPPPV